MHGRAENKLHYDFSFIAMAGSDLNCGTSSASAHFRPWDPPPPTSLFITEETKANGIGEGGTEGGVRQEGPERGGDGGKEGRREGVEMEGRKDGGWEWSIGLGKGTRREGGAREVKQD